MVTVPEIIVHAWNSSQRQITRLLGINPAHASKHLQHSVAEADIIARLTTEQLDLFGLKIEIRRV